MSVDIIRTGVDERLEHPQRALNDAVATAMVNGPSAGLAALEPLEERLADDPRYHAARAHLREMAGEHEKAGSDYQVAASRATSPSQEEYLRKREACLRPGPQRAGS
jgi:predicted RNA polymerase sigma factor